MTDIELPSKGDVEPNDPFLETMFSRMSPGARYLFTPYQLDELKRAFAARSFGSHAVDLRFSFQLFRASYYVVFLMGRERRSQTRIRLTIPIYVLGLAVIAAVVAAFVL